MKTNVGTFPWRTSVQEACDWKEAFEKEAREILTNLQKETNALMNCKSEALARDTPWTAEAYEQQISFDKGRIFSLKQILGDLPP
jgi:hypothetical protein